MANFDLEERDVKISFNSENHASTGNTYFVGIVKYVDEHGIRVKGKYDGLHGTLDIFIPWTSIRAIEIRNKPPVFDSGY